ncbi:dopamine D2-like receptor [Solea senegalensis]|uniref:Dopamine D2-like receptor n=1 Tax=Solea senegalensis TaxID=28829 RepID=A0AAV6SY99_SOLSE|nr:dopamine D2-like receptor [Solea senegalensis]KAG7522187.1 dopamine D2-like receptor [Solea senegalensis]
MRGEPTRAWDSGNNTIWRDYIDITFVVANSLVLLVTSAVGIAANIFVILAVYHQKSLQTSNNALVVNLAIIDILRCAFDCPVLLSIVLAVHEKGRVNELICDAQVASFSFSCCVQLLTLACLSAERHQAIAHPFKTSQRKKRLTVLIPLTWILSFLVAVCCLLFVKDSPVHVSCRGLQRETSGSYDTFGLYMLLPLWAVCFGVIIGFYASIFNLVRAHNRKIFDKGTLPPAKKPEMEDKQKKEEITAVENGTSEQNQKPPPVAQGEPVMHAEQSSSKKDTVLQTSVTAAHCVSSSEKDEEFEKIVITDLETEQPCPTVTEEKSLKTQQSQPSATRIDAAPSNEGGAGSVKSSTAEPQAVLSNVNTEAKEKEQMNQASTEMIETSPHVPSSAQLTGPESTSLLLSNPKQAEDSNGGEAMAATSDQVSTLPPVSGNAPEAVDAIPNIEAEGAVCMMPPKANKERAKKKKESKMAKRAGYIIVTFVLFWLPLISTILVNYFVHKNKNPQRSTIRHVEVLSVSVSCITSLTDPIIYAAVNPQFRTEFTRLTNKVKSTFSKNG